MNDLDLDKLEAAARDDDGRAARVVSAKHLLALIERVRKAEAERLPCDGGCSYLTGPEEECSAHGRRPRELWEFIEKLSVERDELRARLDAPPVYLALDLWQALGAGSTDFDGYYERNGWADTWANLLGEVRAVFEPSCVNVTDGEPCVLRGEHLVHYGASDVGSSEAIPRSRLDAQTPDEDARKGLTRAIGAVVSDSSNHPVPHVVWGRDITALRDTTVEAVLAWLHNNGWTKPTALAEEAP